VFVAHESPSIAEDASEKLAETVDADTDGRVESFCARSRSSAAADVAAAAYDEAASAVAVICSAAAKNSAAAREAGKKQLASAGCDSTAAAVRVSAFAWWARGQPQESRRSLAAAALCWAVSIAAPSTSFSNTNVNIHTNSSHECTKMSTYRICGRKQQAQVTIQTGSSGSAQG
jgi:hypothetical protein